MQYALHLDTPDIDILFDSLPSIEHAQHDNAFYPTFSDVRYEPPIYIPLNKFFQMPSTMEQSS